MRRFRVRPENIVGDRVTFDADETRHLRRVLRLGTGDVVEALDGAGTMLTVRIESTAPRGAEGTVLSRAAHRTESPLRLVLAQGIAKGDKMETIIRMATELGVTQVVPLATARAVVKFEPDRREARVSRWQRVAQEAAKQSGRAVVPEIARPQSLDEWLAARSSTRSSPRSSRGLLVCLWEGALTSLVPQLPQAPIDEATLVIGPEGGLEAAEAGALEKAGAVVGNLGGRILRTETAGPVGLAILQARYGDLGGGGS
jgi:16S rRNA (uracil1498-N3)-methyltransferase